MSDTQRAESDSLIRPKLFVCEAASIGGGDAFIGLLDLRLVLRAKDNLDAVLAALDQRGFQCRQSFQRVRFIDHDPARTLP
jgi:hypothetical protein